MLLLYCRRTIILFLLLLLPSMAWAAQQQLLSGSSETKDFDGATNYGSLLGMGRDVWTTTISDHRITTARTAIFQDLYVRSSAAPTNGTLTITLVALGVATGVGCTIGTSDLECFNAASQSILGKGSFFNVRVTESLTPDPVKLWVTLRDINHNTKPVPFDSYSFMGGSGSVVAGSAGDRFFGHGTESGGTGTEDRLATIMPYGGTMSDLFVDLDTPPGAGFPGVFTASKNAVDQSLTCTVTTPDDDCEDESNSFTYVAGDQIALQSNFGGRGGTATHLSFGIMDRPDEPESSLIAGHTEDLLSNSNGATEVTFLSCGDCDWLATASEADTQNEVLKTFRLRALYISQSAIPGGIGGTYTYTVRLNGVDTSLSCVVTSAVQTCNDTGEDIIVEQGDLLSMEYLVGGAPSTLSKRAKWSVHAWERLPSVMLTS